VGLRVQALEAVGPGKGRFGWVGGNADLGNCLLLALSPVPLLPEAMDGDRTRRPAPWTARGRLATTTGGMDANLARLFETVWRHGRGWFVPRCRNTFLSPSAWFATAFQTVKDLPNGCEADASREAGECCSLLDRQDRIEGKDRRWRVGFPRKGNTA